MRLAIALLLAPTLLAAQAKPARTNDGISLTAGSFFALSVADLDASEKWYVEKLGLTRTQRGGPTGKIDGYAILEGHGWTVELIEHHDSARRPGDAVLTQGFTKVGAVVADFDGAVKLLRDRGVEIAYGPFPAQEKARANVIFKDNAGNLIQLFGGYARR